MSNFTKIRPVGDELLHPDRRTDMTTLTVAFRDFANSPKNVEIDSPASRGGQGKYMKYVSLSWPPLEAALLIFNGSLFR
jgi:hypothetical protein